MADNDNYTSLEGGEGQDNNQYSKRARQMVDGAWVLPFSVALVLKKLENFDTDKFTVDCAMTLILRIKLGGLPEELMSDVKEHVTTKLKCRVNEEEAPFFDDLTG